jgi:predicted nucleic acid-binding protein
LIALDATWLVDDAAHLELAQRRGLPLATLDEELCTAAAALGLRSPGRG